MTGPGVTDLRAKGRDDATRIRSGDGRGKTAAKTVRRGAAKTGGRVSLAVRVGFFDWLNQPRKAFGLFGRKRRRPFLRTLFFGTGRPKGAPPKKQTLKKRHRGRGGGVFTIRIEDSTGWTPEKRSAAAKKAVRKRSRREDGTLT